MFLNCLSSSSMYECTIFINDYGKVRKTKKLELEVYECPRPPGKEKLFLCKTLIHLHQALVYNFINDHGEVRKAQKIRTRKK